MKNIEFAEIMRQRTKTFAINIIKLSNNLPSSQVVQIITKQILRSATSVAANYRATSRARSEAEFYSKLSIVVEEADETVFWLEILNEADLIQNLKIEPFLKEANEILAIFASSRKTIRHNKYN